MANEYFVCRPAMLRESQYSPHSFPTQMKSFINKTLFINGNSAICMICEFTLQVYFKIIFVKHVNSYDVFALIYVCEPERVHLCNIMRLKWPNVRHTCAIIPLSNQHLDMSHL